MHSFIIKAAHLLAHKIAASGYIISNSFLLSMNKIHQWKKLDNLRLYQRFFYISLCRIGSICQTQEINSSTLVTEVSLQYQFYFHITGAELAFPKEYFPSSDSDMGK